jgi:hypothetical protein
MTIYLFTGFVNSLISQPTSKYHHGCGKSILKPAETSTLIPLDRHKSSDTITVSATKLSFLAMPFLYNPKDNDFDVGDSASSWSNPVSNTAAESNNGVRTRGTDRPFPTPASNRRTRQARNAGTGSSSTAQQDPGQRSARTMTPARQTTSAEAANHTLSQQTRVEPLSVAAAAMGSIQRLQRELAASRQSVEQVRAALLSIESLARGEQLNGPSSQAQPQVVNNSAGVREEVVGEQDASTAERSTARE